MNIFQKLKSKFSFDPLVCMPTDIIDFFRECIEINAPSANLEICCHDKIYPIGISSDYTAWKGFFNTEFYLGNQTFSSLEDFCTYAELEHQPFMNLDLIAVTRDLDSGDPRNNTLLAQREIKNPAH